MPSLLRPSPHPLREDQPARPPHLKHLLSAQHRCELATRQLPLLMLLVLQPHVRCDVLQQRVQLGPRHPAIQFVHVSQLRQRVEHAMNQLQFLHQPIQTADDQYPRQHLHRGQLTARCAPASFVLHRHLVPRCFAMCEAHRVLLPQRLMLHCSAPCGKDLVRCVHARTFLLPQATNHFPAWQLQDCVQLQSTLHAFGPHQLQAPPQHRLQ